MSREWSGDIADIGLQSALLTTLWLGSVLLQMWWTRGSVCLRATPLLAVLGLLLIACAAAPVGVLVWTRGRRSRFAASKPRALNVGVALLLGAAVVLLFRGVVNDPS